MNLIVAVDSKWGIGKNNGLLAHLPSDMKYFKEHTTGKVVVMGRKTLESMPGKKGLPNRINIVLTANKNYSADGVIVVHSDEELFAKLKAYKDDDVYIIGGKSMYNKYYNMCNKLFITMMEADLNADVRIKHLFNNPNYKKVSEKPPITENGITYKFIVCQRKNKVSIKYE